MRKPRFYRHLAFISLLSLMPFVSIPGHAADNDVPVVVKIAGIPWFTAGISVGFFTGLMVAVRPPNPAPLAAAGVRGNIGGLACKVRQKVD